MDLIQEMILKYFELLYYNIYMHISAWLKSNRRFSDRRKRASWGTADTPYIYINIFILTFFDSNFIFVLAITEKGLKI